MADIEEQSATETISLEQQQEEEEVRQKDIVSPPVLDVSSSSPSTTQRTSPTNTTANTSTATATASASGNNESLVQSGRTTSRETVPGLNAMMSEWQISSLPDYQQFFSTEDESILEAAVEAIKARLDENDSNIRKTWLLTEIDHWDFEKERIVLLTDNNLISVKYNFIHQSIEEIKYIPLAYIREIRIGEFTYTHSYAHTRKGKGMKVIWGEEALGFFTKWNPISTSVPYTTFASHILVRNNKLIDPKLTLDTAIDLIESTIVECRQRVGQGSSAPEFRKTEDNLIIDYYLGTSAMIHNQSYLGFFKKRGALNW